MRNGVCPKCGSKKVYHCDANGTQSGVTTGNGSISVRLYKENNWIPDIQTAKTSHYLCQNCGYLESYVTNVTELSKLDDFDNWKLLNPSE